MIKYRSSQFLTVGIVGVLTCLAGCAAQVGGIQGQRVGGGVLLRKPLLEGENPKQLEWLPVVGRMDDYARKRHLAASDAWTVILDDTFVGATEAEVPGWRLVGRPDLKPVVVAGAQGIKMSAPIDGPKPFLPVGMERMLNPKQLKDRDVRIEVQLACRSARQSDALKGIRLSLFSLDANDELNTLSLSLVGDMSPGWETRRWHVRFHPTVGPVALRIHAIRPGALATLRRVRLSISNRVGFPATSSRTFVATQPAGVVPKNVIVGGDFESGQRTFFGGATRHWSNGEEMPVPLLWAFDGEAAVHDKSLRIDVVYDDARVGFGPLNLTALPQFNRPSPLRSYLSFHARATRTATMSVTLRTCSRVIAKQRFQLLTDWKQFTSSINIPAHMFDDRRELASAELLFEVENDGETDLSGPLVYWLDGVAFTDQALTSNYAPPAPIEVGLFVPGPNHVDVANLVDAKELAVFSVRLITSRAKGAVGSSVASNDSSMSSGRFAIDVLDAWDRVVWTRTTSPVIPKNKISFTDTIQLRLPRGYYRVLATLWSGKPGQSTIVSQASMPLGVIAVDDPVPWGSPFGLTARNGLVSQRTTHLGAGWVRMDLPTQRVQTAEGSWDFALWQEVVSQCEQAQIETVLGLTLPSREADRKPFIEQWLAATTSLPIGLVLSPPAISRDPTAEYLRQLTRLREMLSGRTAKTRIIGDLSALGGAGKEWTQGLGARESGGELAVGIACTETPLPENSEALLHRIGRQYVDGPKIWDLGVPVQIGGAPIPIVGHSGAHGWFPLGAKIEVLSGTMARLENPLDPVLSASRMIRSILIRGLAGAQFVCCDAVALSPVRSICDDNDRERLHEADLSPRVALVAFDLMTSLLNDALLVRWIDEPVTGCRVLYFEKDDGRAVAAVWRPFGLSPSRLGLTNLPSKVELIDCVAVPETVIVEGAQRIVLANEIVRYLIAPAAQREAFRRSLDTLQPVSHSTSQPVL